MKAFLAILLLAAAAFGQSTGQTGQTAPETPSAATPDDTPLPPKKTRGLSELEAVNSREPGVLSLGKYEGGSWSLKPNRLTTYVNEKEIVLVQNKQRMAIPVKAVTQVLYGNGAAAQVGQAIGNTGLGGGIKSSSHPTLVGIVWTAGNTRNGIVLQMDKGDFDGCMNALQSVTGRQALNTDSKGR